ncbi:MAG: competence/damage-inducible protein A [Armatimonadetes bacterium CG07_land_8_20_14_0_80_40_9]|nr:MAG: competence/damage-inducible protein A [Armatimonadetes bacterium CG07_land_8_20_14_0_80_40_9]
MNAEIISIGTELLLGQIVDTNSAYLSQKLAELGIDIYLKTTVGDNKRRILSALKKTLKRAELIITVGGLGPTQDDLTKKVIAQALNKEMILNKRVAKMIESYFLRQGLKFTENNLQQARFPQGAKIIYNPLGTAPGMIIKKEDKIIIALPGPPRELKPMFEEQIFPYLRKKKSKGMIIKSKVLRVVGLGESLVEERIKEILRQDSPTIAPLVSQGEVHLRITAKGDNKSEIDKRIREVKKKIKRNLGDYIYGEDLKTLEEVVANLLLKEKRTLSVAESCSGGLISHKLTNVSGSSNYYLGGIVCYSNKSKIDLLRVPKETIAQKGAVSRECAISMAKGVRMRFSADLGLAITGIAGPKGGTKDKPVGLVYIALADKKTVQCQEFKFRGARIFIKQKASLSALDILRRYLK